MIGHRIFVIGIVILLLITLVVTVYAADSDIVLSEIMANAIIENVNQGEWVEICNRGTAAVDVINWQLEDNGGSSFADTITAAKCPSGSCSIPARTCWLIAITATDLSNEFSNYSPAPSVDTSKTIFLGSGQRIGNGLANTNDHLILRNGSGIAVDCYSWDGSGICASLTYVSGGNGVDANFDGSNGQPITNVQGVWGDGDGNGSPYDIINTHSGGSPTAVVLSSLGGRSQAPGFPVWYGIGAVVVIATAFFAYHHRRPH